MKEDNRITFEQLEDEIVLVCRAAERPDEGNYSVTLRNNKGSDTANIRVNILDKPGVPEGPLEVSKITPESCTLKWNPPKVCFFVLYRLFFVFIVCRLYFEQCTFYFVSRTEMAECSLTLLFVLSFLYVKHLPSYP